MWRFLPHAPRVKSFSRILRKELVEKRDKLGRRYCVERGQRARVPCPGKPGAASQPPGQPPPQQATPKRSATFKNAYAALDAVQDEISKGTSSFDWNPWGTADKILRAVGPDKQQAFLTELGVPPDKHSDPTNAIISHLEDYRSESRYGKPLPAIPQPIDFNSKDDLFRLVSKWLLSRKTNAPDVLNNDRYAAKNLAHHFSRVSPGIGHADVAYALGVLDMAQRDTLVDNDEKPPNGDLPDQARPELTQPEKVSLSLYSVIMDRNFNRRLRNGEPIPEIVKHRYDQLRSAFAKVKTFSKPVKVFRGMRMEGDALMKYISALNGAVGKTIEVSGFISTSTGGIAEDWQDSNVQLQIDAVSGLDMMPWSAFPDERELLLDHNSRFKVKSVEEREGKIFAHLEQVPPVRKEVQRGRRTTRTKR